MSWSTKAPLPSNFFSSLYSSLWNLQILLGSLSTPSQQINDLIRVIEELKNILHKVGVESQILVPYKGAFNIGQCM
jgi:hypothetical protein